MHTRTDESDATGTESSANADSEQQRQWQEDSKHDQEQHQQQQQQEEDEAEERGQENGLSRHLCGGLSGHNLGQRGSEGAGDCAARKPVWAGLF
jgi:hypothetical protein